MISAAEMGRLDVLQYAHEHGVPWDHRLTFVAARSCFVGSLECLQYAVTHGCPWAEDTLDAAARNRMWDKFKYALEHGCPYNPQVAGVVAGTSLPMFQYLREQGYAWDPDDCLDQVLYAGFLDVDLLRDLRSHGAQWPKVAAFHLVRGGHLPALQFPVCECNQRFMDFTGGSTVLAPVRLFLGLSGSSCGC